MPSRQQWYRVRMIEYERGDMPGHPGGSQITIRVLGRSRKDVESRHAAQGKILSVDKLGPEVDDSANSERGRACALCGHATTDHGRAGCVAFDHATGRFCSCKAGKGSRR